MGLESEVLADEAELDGVCEGAESVGGVGAFVVERLGGEVAMGARRSEAVAAEGVETGNVFAGIASGAFSATLMENAGIEELAGVVDGEPEIGSGGDAGDGVTGGAESVGVGLEVDVAAGDVVRADTESAARPEGVV